MFRLFLSCLLCLVLWPVGAAAAEQTAENSGPEVFTSISEILKLGREGARTREHKARLHAYVTLASAYHGQMTFIQDATGAMRMDLERGVARPLAGQEIEAQGYLVGGLFAPYFVARKVTVIGKGTPPVPRRIQEVRLGLNADDGAWAVIKGQVRNASVVWGFLRLHISSGGQMWEANLGSPGPLAMPELMIGAEVEVTGAAILIRERFRGPSGAALWYPNAQFLNVIRPAPVDRYATPIVPLAAVPANAPHDGSRVHVRGTVTLASPSDRVGLTDDTGSMEVKLLPVVRGDPYGRYIDLPAVDALKVGDTVEVLGAPATRDGFFFLDQAEYRLTGHGTPVKPVFVDLKDASSAGMDGHLVTLKGEVVSLPVAVPDDGLYAETILLRQGDNLFEAVWETLHPEPWKPRLHSWVTVTGTCSSTARHDGSRAVRINLREPGDVSPAAPPSFWERPETLRTLGWVGLAVTVAGAWIFLLRRLVRRRTSELKAAVDQLSSEIAEKRAAQGELLRFKAVCETTSDLVAMSDLEGRTMYMNSAGRKLTGIGEHESLAGIRVSDVYPERVNKTFEEEGFPAAMEKGFWRAEIAMLHRDRREIPVSFVGLIIRSPEGQPLYMACIARDITEQRHMEQQLRDSLAKEREVGEMKSNFVNLVSHEFRTPLGIIMSSAGILENYLDRLTPDKRRQCLLDIQRATRLMSGLVEDVLHLGKLSANREDCQMEPVDLAALCREFADEVRSSTCARCPIEINTARLEAPALADESLLRSVLTNLLSNAVKFSAPGTPVTFRIERNQQDAIFTIADRGIGIAPEDQERLFEAFHRGANVGEQNGTGLGLAIVKRCTELHSGRIDIFSELGRGTTATVRLPLFSPPIHHEDYSRH
jgi:PAS domain S-box-containing protein